MKDKPVAADFTISFCKARGFAEFAVVANEDDVNDAVCDSKVAGSFDNEVGYLHVE